MYVFTALIDPLISLYREFQSGTLVFI